MCSIDVGICHDDDLVIAQFRDVKIIAVSFGKTTSKCIDHRLDLCICKHLVNTCFLNI